MGQQPMVADRDSLAEDMDPKKGRDHPCPGEEIRVQGQQGQDMHNDDRAYINPMDRVRFDGNWYVDLQFNAPLAWNDGDGAAP